MRKNILIFGHGYQHGFIAATNQYTELFDDKEYDVTVVYLAGEANEKIKQQHIAKNIIFLDTPKQNMRGLKIGIIKMLLALHKEKNFHIVITHRYKPTFIMLLVNLFRKIPHLICVMHDLGTIKNTSRKIFIRMFANKNTIFAGVSNAVRDDLKKSLTKVKTTTLYNVINIQESESNLQKKEHARSLLNLTDQPFVFGILGRLVEAKDHQTLIKAFSLIKPQCPTAKLVIIGDGELYQDLKNQISQLKLNDTVILTGYLPDAPSLLTAFDIFVLSSQREAFGRVLLEAMVAKCPIIATKTDGVPEVLGEIGILVDKNNPEALAQAMKTFYEMPTEKRQKQSELSYQHVTQVFSPEHFKESFWRLLIS